MIHATADVEIYEDGARQQIRSFRLVTASEAPSQPAPQNPAEQTSSPAPLPPAAPAPASPMPLRAVNLVCIVFHNLDSVTRKWAVSAAQEYINTQLRPGAWVGIFNLDSRLTPMYPFTTNREALLRAAANAFYGTSVDISRAADAVLNSTPNVILIAGFLPLMRLRRSACFAAACERQGPARDATERPTTTRLVHAHRLAARTYYAHSFLPECLNWTVFDTSNPPPATGGGNDEALRIFTGE